MTSLRETTDHVQWCFVLWCFLMASHSHISAMETRLLCCRARTDSAGGDWKWIFWSLLPEKCTNTRQAIHKRNLVISKTLWVRAGRGKNLKHIRHTSQCHLIIVKIVKEQLDLFIRLCFPSQKHHTRTGYNHHGQNAWDENLKLFLLLS